MNKIVNIVLKILLSGGQLTPLQTMLLANASSATCAALLDSSIFSLTGPLSSSKRITSPICSARFSKLILSERMESALAFVLL